MQFDAEFLKSAVSNDYLPYIRVYSQKQIVKSASFVDPQTNVHFKCSLRFVAISFAAQCSLVMMLRS